MTRWIVPSLFLTLFIGCTHDSAQHKSTSEAGDSPPITETEAANLYSIRCASCHGAEGKGDSPLGRTLHLSDLSTREWQEKTSDKDIEKVIVQGRGQMPAFKLSEPERKALVKTIRSFR